MPSQFFGLNIAYSGLLNSNASMNTTANNIANVQTEGYSRQQVTSQAADALRVFQTYGCAGAGVETLTIERIRDEYFDLRYWANGAKVGEYAQKQYYMQQIESYFDDNGQNAGFKTVFDRFMITGLQELMKNPADLSFKQQFISYAETLTEYFNGVAGNLEKVQKDANEEIKVKVDEINSIASEIATLNKQINVIEMSGNMLANELRDRRTLLLDQLSQIVDVETKETKIADTNNPDRETGGTRLIVKIAGGQVLIDGNEYNGLECVARTDREKVNQTDVDGLYDVYWTGTGSKFNLYNASMGGALKGLVDLRDGNNSESFSGVISAVDPGSNTVTVSVDKHYLTDLNKCNLSDSGGIVNLGGKLYYYDSWTYSIKYDQNGEAEYSYTFNLSTDKDENGNDLNPALTADRNGKQATVGASISYQGVPYYMAQMNEWIRTFSQKFNDILTSGYSGETPGIDLFAANMTTEDGQYVFDAAYRYDMADVVYQQMLDAEVKKLTDAAEANGDDITDATILAGILSQAKINVANTGIDVTVGRGITNQDNYYLMTAQNFGISSTVSNDPNRLANKKNAEDGVEQKDLLEELKLLATDKSKMSFRGCSASEFLQCILADVALNTERAETFYRSYSDIATTIDTQRISVSGVDEDEEAVNLVKFQHGYNLASKMIQVLTEVYDRLILETGV